MKIPDKAKTAFQGSMQNSGTVELPFPAPPFYIVNGNPQLAAIGGFQHFGGWACNADKIKDAADHWTNVPFPISGLVTADIFLDGGKKLSVLGSRSLLVAPIGMRQFSSVFDQNTNQTRRVAPFTPGARPGLQVLCVLGYKDVNKVIQVWAPIMITAKGFQVNHVQKAFASWQKTIFPVIKRMIHDADSSVSNLFWMSIGTFGPELKQEYVGSGQRMPITPVSAFMPETVDEEVLERLYVGDQVAEFMADLSSESAEWLKVFENMEPAQKKAQPVQAGTDLYEPPPPEEDDIPF